MCRYLLNCSAEKVIREARQAWQGHFFVSDPSVFHVVSKKEENNEIFRVHLLPPHDEWRHVFAFKADQIQRSENDTILFVYPPSSTGNHIISTALYINSSERFPTDFFIARRNEVTTNIFEVHSGYNFSNKITISNQSTDCCPTVWETTIPIFLLSGKFLIGWFSQLQKSRIEHMDSIRMSIKNKSK